MEKSVKEIKTSLEYIQKDVDELKPLQSKIVMANEEINKLKHGLIVQVTFDGISGEPKPAAII